MASYLMEDSGTIIPTIDMSESREAAIMFDTSARTDWVASPQMIAEYVQSSRGITLIARPSYSRVMPQLVVRGHTLGPQAAVRILLDDRDFAAFTDHLSNPPEPTAELRSLFAEFGAK